MVAVVPAKVVGGVGVGGAVCVGLAGDGDGEGVADDALVDCVPCGGLMVRVLLAMVLGVGLRLGGPGCRVPPLLAEGLACLVVGCLSVALRSWWCRSSLGLG